MMGRKQRLRIDHSWHYPLRTHHRRKTLEIANVTPGANIANIAIVAMKSVTATEAKNRLGVVLEDAQRGPVVIRRQDRDVAVVLSMADYQRLRSGNIRAFLELRDEVASEAKEKGLTLTRLDALLADDAG